MTRRLVLSADPRDVLSVASPTAVTLAKSASGVVSGGTVMVIVTWTEPPAASRVTSDGSTPYLIRKEGEGQ